MYIGRRNVTAVTELLDRAGIRYDASNVHGRKGRRVSFDTSTGRLRVDEVRGTRDAESFGIRLLIIDGSEDTRRSIKRGLENTHGITVVGEASNPFEAQELIVSTHPNVVTMSIEMDKMHGLDFLERLMHSYPLPIVIISWPVRPESGAARRALQLGAAAVINKEDLRLFDGGRTAAKVLVPILEAAASKGKSRMWLM